jgi:hypothetical protein
MGKKMRRCPNCGETKPLDEFYKTPGYCKPCAKIRASKHFKKMREEGGEKYENHKKHNNDYMVGYNKDRRNKRNSR